MKHSSYSIVIIGSGVAGLYAAEKLARHSAKCGGNDGILLITKSKLGESNSRYAQGGIVGVMKSNSADSVELHVKDTIKAGAGLSEFGTVKFVSEISDTVVKDLISMGVEFDKDENGKLAYTLEGAHSIKRVLHAGGDATGRVIEQALCEKVKSNPDIDIYEKTMAVELLSDLSGECKGVIVFDEETQEYEAVCSSAVILAAGGLGQLYKYTTNPAGATADGIALAYRAGAVLQDMEFVQFHPTALAVDNGVNRFLISEAVRGEGAKLVDADGYEFMHKYHKLKELAPRDIVTRAIFNEMSENNSQNVWLNAACIDAEKLQKCFPNISQKCLENGIDISKDFIPVAPAAHYSMGGIKADVNGETSVKGLFAIGETASTGLHGGNRLASNSLLECIACAYSVAEHLCGKELRAPKHIDLCVKSQMDKYSVYDENPEEFESRTAEQRKALREIMWENAGILRSEESLNKALEELDKIILPKKYSCREDYELNNMLTAAKLIVRCALERKESRGAHFRVDFPQESEQCIHSMIGGQEGRKAGGQAVRC